MLSFVSFFIVCMMLRVGWVGLLNGLVLLYLIV